MKSGFLPIFNPASPETFAISHVFKIVLIICGIILLVVTIIISLGVLRYHQRPGFEERTSRSENKKLELLWTVIPGLIVVGLFVLTVRGMRLSDPAVDRDPDIIVIGHQWWWEARYPVKSQGDAVTANEIHIPVGRKILVRLESADVIHDFWVPELARKMQNIPGHPNSIWMEADSAGNYEGDCVEYCGAQHSWMRITVVAEPPATFDAWLNDQKKSAAVPVADSLQKGRDAFQTMTCANCHSIRGVSSAASAGPDLTHFMGRKTLGAGVLSNTPERLFSWLKNPQAIKPGCFMPDLKLTDAQAHTLANYLETLR